MQRHACINTQKSNPETSVGAAALVQAEFKMENYGGLEVQITQCKKRKKSKVNLKKHFGKKNNF